MTAARDLSKLGNQNALKVDTTNTRVGVNSTSPDSTLDVGGEIIVGSGASINTSGEAVFIGVVTSVGLHVSGSDITGVGTQGIDIAARGLVIAGVSTFYGTSSFADDVKVTAGGLDVVGVITSNNKVVATGLDIGTAGVDIDGQTDLDELVVAGVATFSAALDIGTGGVDIDGQLDADEVVVAGAATFSSSVKIDGAVDIGTGGVDIDGQLDLDELVVAGVATFSNNIIGTGATIYNATTGTEVGIVSALAIKGACTQVPQNAQGSTYTLLSKDAGKHINAANTITVDDGVFQIGDCVSIFNDTGGNITITQGSGVTLRLVATSTTGSRTLATYGLATLLCVGGDAGGGNEFVVSGGGVT